MIAITIYTILVGADAAVVRAAIMGSFPLFAGLVGRHQSGYSLLRTDQNGWIHITTDGQQMWVEAER